VPSERSPARYSIVLANVGLHPVWVQAKMPAAHCEMCSDNTVQSILILAELQGDLVSNSLGVIDNTREITLSGTIKYVRLVGERSRIQLLVTNQLARCRNGRSKAPASAPTRA
jgi:hypothetical protein